MGYRAMAELRTRIRVRAEGLGITSKTVVTFLVLLYDSKREGRQGELALLAFAGGQLAYAFFVFITYLGCYGRLHLWPKAPSQIKCVLVLVIIDYGSPDCLYLCVSRGSLAAYVDPDMLRLSLTMTSQSVIKHFLTEGDKMILSWCSPLQDQGGYAIAVNYGLSALSFSTQCIQLRSCSGSLVARIVFQPVEETSRVFFSKLLASPTRESSSSNTNGQVLRQAAGALLSLLSVQASLSVILLVFGTAYMPIVLHILLPWQYISTSAPRVLAAWVWYIPVLAVNGVLEAFLSSVATPQDLNKQSR
jgi:oligosaccharide translocation protein RFT1